jgi:hypothetical protein
MEIFMSPATQITLVSIAGLLSTAIVGGIGLYFIARGRSAPLRQHLYEEQLAIVVRLVRIIGKIRTFAPTVVESSGASYERALADLRVKVRQLAETKDTAAAILPTELYVEISQLSSVVTDFLIDHDGGRDVRWFPGKLAGHAAKTALLARTYLGVDELSAESARLFSPQGNLAQIASMSPDAIAESAKAHIQKQPPNDR